MINKIFAFFISIGVVYALISNNIIDVNNVIIGSAKESLDIFMNIFPVIVLWLGIMTIATDSGLLIKISNLLYPILKKIFPNIPKGHPSLGYISSNITANLLGLGNASTPFGLKAMKSLQELNKNKEVASSSMITFILLNTSGLTIIPTTIISLRLYYKSINPTKTLLITIIVTLFSTIIAVILDKIINKVRNE